MNLIESLQNTIFFSNKTLQKLEESKYIINKIETINENNKKQISYADKILESFKSFYNRINYPGICLWQRLAWTRTTNTSMAIGQARSRNLRPNSTPHRCPRIHVSALKRHKCR